MTRMLVEEATCPDGVGRMRLTLEDELWAIDIDGHELMSTEAHGSEDALADLACDRLSRTDRARVLVGGLGLGYTLAAALRRVGPRSRVTVAELVPAVVSWNREHLGPAAGHPLRDPRTRVHLGDVGGLVAGSRDCWDAILLDVDNGPTAMTTEENGWLYDRQGLKAAFLALRAGGVLGIWSAENVKGFSSRMRKVGFTVERFAMTDHGVPARDGDGIHVIWIGVKGERARAS